jgi:hypothetical protein
MLKRITVSTALVLAAMAGPAFAQYRGLTGPGSQEAYNRGYRDGVKEGEKDARDRKYFEFERDNKYRKADAGYKRDFGDRENYRRVFRQGYATGYADGYNGRYRGGYPEYGTNRRAVPRGYPGAGYPSTYPGRYPGTPRSPGGVYGGYGSEALRVAADNGYRDGIEKGREDRRKNRNADPVRHEWYRSADRGYDGDRGLSKTAYRDAYREAFRQGYDEGYRQYAW